MTGPVYPVPEFIKGSKGAGWDIQDARTGGAKTQPGILHVPLDMACFRCGKAHSLAVRNHEIAHAEITLDKHGRMPVLPRGLKNEYFQAVEDARIWMHVNQSYYNVADETSGASSEVGNPPALCPEERDKWEAVYQGLDDKGRVLFAVAAGAVDLPLVQDIVLRNTPPEAKLDGASIMRIRDSADQMLRMDRNPHSNPYRSFQSSIASDLTPNIIATYETAAFLQDLLEPPEEKEKGEKPDPKEGSDPGDEGKADAREEAGEAIGIREATPAEAKEAREKEKRDNRHRDKSDLGDGWLPVTMQEPVLGRHLPGRLYATYQAAEEGAFIRRPDRLYVDQKIFGKKKRVQGGAVLIDDSGSMGMDYDEILSIMLAVPGATIGVYSATGSMGFLRIVARNGRMVAEERDVSTPGGGNGIDGPALEWLAQQPFTRKAWVSDGYVTGSGDRHASNLILQRDIILKRNPSITWVNPHVVGRSNLPSATVNALLGRQLLARKGA